MGGSEGGGAGEGEEDTGATREAACGEGWGPGGECGGGLGSGLREAGQERGHFCGREPNSSSYHNHLSLLGSVTFLKKYLTVLGLSYSMKDL